MSIGALGQVSNILGRDIAHHVQTVINHGDTGETFIVHKSEGVG